MHTPTHRHALIESSSSTTDWESSRLDWADISRSIINQSSLNLMAENDSFTKTIHFIGIILTFGRFPLWLRHCDWNNKLLIASYYNFFIFHYSPSTSSSSPPPFIWRCPHRCCLVVIVRAHLVLITSSFFYTFQMIR